MARRPLDLSSLTRAEQIVLGAGALLVADGFVPWWYRIQTAHGTFSYNAGLTGFGVVAVAAGALAAIGVLARSAIWPEPAPRADGSGYAFLGAVAAAALILQLGRSHAEWIGSYVALGLAVALTAGGMLRRRQRCAGWQ